MIDTTFPLQLRVEALEREMADLRRALARLEAKADETEAKDVDKDKIVVDRVSLTEDKP